jgi:hypothetical protein
MGLDGVPPQALVRLHGELLAYGWLEMKIGMQSGSPNGMVPRCYGATAVGRRALRDVRAGVGLNGGISTEAT